MPQAIVSCTPPPIPHNSTVVYGRQYMKQLPVVEYLQCVLYSAQLIHGM